MHFQSQHLPMLPGSGVPSWLFPTHIRLRPLVTCPLSHLLNWTPTQEGILRPHQRGASCFLTMQPLTGLCIHTEKHKEEAVRLNLSLGTLKLWPEVKACKSETLRHHRALRDPEGRRGWGGGLKRRGKKQSKHVLLQSIDEKKLILGKCQY